MTTTASFDTTCLGRLDAATPLLAASGDVVRLGHGELTVVRAQRRDDPTLAARVQQALPTPEAMAFGFLGFAPDDAAIFFIPEHTDVIARADLLKRIASPALSTEDTGVVDVNEPWTESDYAAAATRVLTHIGEDNRLRKLVLGRWLHVKTDPVVTPHQLITRLIQDNPAPYVFGLPADVGTDGPSAWLVGASPELLISRHGHQLRSVPLAGSAPRGQDPEADTQRSTRLLASTKARDEHAFVVEAIAQTLGELTKDLRIEATPHLIATDTMWHLATQIEARLPATSAGQQPDTPQRGHRPTQPARPAGAKRLGRTDVGRPYDALRLAQLMHPTPAVAGTPTAEALDLIAEVEPAPRGPLTGAVGWVNGRGDGEFAVAIRSALLDGAWARLFAGAGLVAASSPVCEGWETSAKLRTMLSALVGSDRAHQIAPAPQTAHKTPGAP